MVVVVCPVQYTVIYSICLSQFPTSHSARGLAQVPVFSRELGSSSTHVRLSKMRESSRAAVDTEVSEARGGLQRAF